MRYRRASQLISPRFAAFIQKTGTMPKAAPIAPAVSGITMRAILLAVSRKPVTSPVRPDGRAYRRGMDLWLHQMTSLEHRERARARMAERRATWADRRARRKRKIVVDPQHAADVAAAAQAPGGWRATQRAPRP